MKININLALSLALCLGFSSCTITNSENAKRPSGVKKMEAVNYSKLPGEVKIDQWQGHRRYNFIVNGCEAWVVAPDDKAAEGNPWVWCMEFPGAFYARCAAPELIAKGYHHCFVKVGNTFACPAAVETFKQFYAVLQDIGLAEKGVLIGISRGGLYAYRFAAALPGAVNVIYGDAPVCDFKSWPGGKGKGVGSVNDWNKLIKDYAFADEAAALAYRENPIDLLENIRKQNIAIVHVVGDVDRVVPWLENTAVVEERYKKLGGTMQVFHKADCDHHPHGLEDPTPVVNFIVEHNK